MILFHIEKLELIRQATPFCTGAYVLYQTVQTMNSLHVDGSGSVGRTLDRGLKGCLFEFHCRLSHFTVSMSKTL